MKYQKGSRIIFYKYYVYSDLCNLFQKECEIKYSHKLHYNKYEPVVFGYDKDSKLNVLSYSDDKISTLKDSKFYVADKETLGSFLKNYRNYLSTQYLYLLFLAYHNHRIF